MLAGLTTYLNKLKFSINCYESLLINKQQKEDKLELIAAKKKQIWQLTQLYGQYLEAKALLKDLLNELKILDLSLEEEMKADILEIFEAGDREDINSYLCASIVQVYTYFQEVEKSLIDLKEDCDRLFI